MMDGFDGKVALVTGAASGIGRETARQLAAEGARLVLCDRDGAGLETLCEELGEGGACLLTETVDVSDRRAMRAFAERVHGRVPAVDLLVNNAGVGLSGGILDTSLDDWDWVLGVNLWGVIHGCHFFVPPMVERGEGGHVVNISSVAGFVAAPELLGYATSKFAVFGLSEALRTELAPHDIPVTTICPGIIHTGIVQTARYRGTDDEDAMRRRVGDLYRKRNYGPEKVAKAILDGVRRNRAVVPVTPEAWGLYYLKRAAPAAGTAAVALMGRQARG